jgi:hypothetical protein
MNIPRRIDPMVAETFGGVATLKSAFDLARRLKDIDDVARRDSAMVRLQQKILDAQHAHGELIEKATALEREVRRLKSWDADIARYQLTEIAPGVVALAIRDDMRAEDPFHMICVNCCCTGRKSYLQQLIRGQYYDEYKCNACGEELRVDKGIPQRGPNDCVGDFVSVRN